MSAPYTTKNNECYAPYTSAVYSEQLSPPPPYSYVAPLGAPYPQQPGYSVNLPNVGFVGYPAEIGPSAQSVYNASGGSFPYQPGGREVTVPTSNAVSLDDDRPQDAGPLNQSFSTKAIRAAFVRKVYLILLVQFMVTLGIVALFTFHDGVKRFVQRNIIVYFVSYGIFFVTYLSLVCCSSLRRKWPANFIMLGIFTLSLSYMAGTISSAYDTKIVFMAVGITAVICFLLTLFASQTKFDITGCGIYLFVMCMVLFIFGIVALIVQDRIMNMVYSAGIALLFSMYLVYDTQMLIGGRKHELSPEEYIFGALMLYLDVVQIFLAILSLSKN